MQVFTWPGKKREFAALAFDATGRSLAAGGDRQHTAVWDVVTGAERGPHQSAHAALGFTPVGNRLVLSNNFGLWVHDPGEKAYFAVFARGSYVGAVAVHPARDLAVCYHHFHPDRSKLSAVTLDREPPEIAWDAPIRDLPNEQGYSTGIVPVGADAFASAEEVYGPNRSNFRYRVAIRAWDDGRLLRALPRGSLGYGDCIFGSPHSTALVIQDGIWLRLYATDEPDAPPRQIRNDGRKHFTGVAFYPGGRFFAATSNDTTVKLFDATSLEVVRTFTWDIGRLRSVAFSPDGALAAAGSDSGKVVVWDVDL